jgi:aspartyl-tRNA(Asn)/glutamyl-tRNA(Gln) amidotransferase subunit C
MVIDSKLISHLEDLSCFTLPNDEKVRLTEELQKIFAGITRLSELNTDGVQECTHLLDNINAFREDEIRPSLDRELVLKNAPVRNDEFFVAPKTVE